MTLTLIGIARDYLLSEGAIGGFFTTEIAIGNPNDTPAPIRVSFLRSGGGTVDLDDEVPAMSRKTIVANDVAALDAPEFSTVVRSLTGLPLIVERTMTWNRETGYGAHTERATDTPSTKWYFAEGSQGFFSTFLLLANPNTVMMTATVDYLREGEPTVTRTYDVPALSRRTIHAGDDEALVNRSFGMVVTFTQPGLAERAMYFGMDPLWRGGHASAGVTRAVRHRVRRRGRDRAVLRDLHSDRESAARRRGRGAHVPAAGRCADRDVADRPGVEPPHAQHRDARSRTCERAGGDQHHRVGSRHRRARAVLAGSGAAMVRSARQPGAAGARHEVGPRGGPSGRRVELIRPTSCSRIRIASADAHVSITFLRESGAPFTKTFTVPASQRFNVQMGPGTNVPELVDERFGALITSDQPIVVERAMYADAGGQTWAAGTSANATPVP